MSKLFVSSLMLLAFTLSSCTQKNNLENAADGTANTAGKLIYPESGARCPNGEAAGYLRGSCGGHWTYTPVSASHKVAQCSYEWGPTVSCPTGTKAIGYEAVCYGVSVKDVAETNAVTKTEQCSQAFGVTPSDPHYELVCCPVAAMVAPAKQVPAGTGG